MSRLPIVKKLYDWYNIQILHGLVNYIITMLNFTNLPNCPFGITYLNIFMYANEWFLKCIEARWVQHFLLDSSCIWTPSHQKKFLLVADFCGALTLMFILHIIQAISTFALSSFRQICQKTVIGCISSTHSFYSNALFVFDEKHNVSMLFVLLDFFKNIFAFIIDSYARRLLELKENENVLKGVTLQNT